MNLKAFLDNQVNLKNSNQNLFNAQDPLWIATKFKEPNIALICALFGYGNAKLIVKFLESLNFSLLDEREEEIKKFYKNHKYRFQNSDDITQIFITIKRLRNDLDIEEVFKKGYKKRYLMIDAIKTFIDQIYMLNSYTSMGYKFFFGKSFDKKPISPYKRYNMFLRWMIRDSDIDLGLFKGFDKKDLLIPLDVHTHRVSLNLGLISRKSYDFEAVNLLTHKLREFDKKDPIKYDFALYRLGQSGEINEILNNINNF
ncbi:TIGR02757 family protein [Campylobacter sp. FMV-PI01]|uniref:TIGR02757 family protein n=1 Tax=Campylobacter portucalensis TaxID=2608384 RepID=A0A6L5WM69_9BACT|nr:TIGR02757 family protein [Campylobacter portucalensis]MSN97095.1 TIGR02757 family protein [Campylobacter portucalensis]